MNKFLVFILAAITVQASSFTDWSWLMTPSFETMCIRMPIEIRLMIIESNIDLELYKNACLGNPALMYSLSPETRKKLKTYVVHYAPYRKYPMQAAVSCIFDFAKECDIRILIKLNEELEQEQARFILVDFVRMALIARKDPELFKELLAKAEIEWIPTTNRSLDLWTHICSIFQPAQSILMYPQCLTATESAFKRRTGYLLEPFQTAARRVMSMSFYPIEPFAIELEKITALFCFSSPVPLSFNMISMAELMYKRGTYLSANWHYETIKSSGLQRGILATVNSFFERQMLEKIMQGKNQYQVIWLLSYPLKEETAELESLYFTKTWALVRIRLIQLGYKSPRAFANKYLRNSKLFNNQRKNRICDLLLRET